MYGQDEEERRLAAFRISLGGIQLSQSVNGTSLITSSSGLTRLEPYDTHLDHETSGWMQKSSADPMAGWSLDAVLGSSAKYGNPQSKTVMASYTPTFERSLVAFCDQGAK